MPTANPPVVTDKVTLVYAVLREDGSVRYGPFRSEGLPGSLTTPYELHPLGTAAALEKAEAALNDVRFRLWGRGPAAEPLGFQVDNALATLAQLRAGKEKNDG